MIREQRILTRTGTLDEWLDANPVLFNGEIANVKDIKKFKVGDGVSTFSQLDYYYSDETVLSEYLDFPILEVPPDYKEGRLWYDEHTKSLSYYSDTEGSSLQIGRELWVRARNTTGSTIQDGSVVYITGATGQTPNVSLALAGTTPKVGIIGVATSDIPNNGFGEVTTYGLVNNLDTSSLTQGQPVYLSSTIAGNLTSTPQAEGSRVKIGVCLNSHNVIGTILVNVQDAEDYAIASEVAQVLNTKEDAFSKNTAFNKNFGTTAGTVTQGNDARLSNSREWSASTVSQAEAEGGSGTTRRAWTAQRVRQAILGWWNNTQDKADLDDLKQLRTFPPIKEEITLAQGQTVVTFVNDISSTHLYITGDNVDSGRIFQGKDYQANIGTQTVTLFDSYPAGTKIVSEPSISNLSIEAIANEIPYAFGGNVVGSVAGALDNKVDKVTGKQLSTEDYSTAEKNKLNGIATGATANATNDQLRDRTTHTGTQPVSTITGLGTAATANILGTVSQSSGVPTGAIIERGSNSDGEYVRYADGTQICHSATALGSITEFGTGTWEDPYRTATQNINYPVSFVALGSSTVVCITVNVNETSHPRRRVFATYRSRIETRVNDLQVFRVGEDNHASTPVVHITATGRWF